MTDQEIYNNGDIMTTYLKEDNECYKSKAAEVEDGMISPQELLTIWEDGYNYKYGGETEYASSSCDIIYLYPKNPKESKFHTIKLIINREKSEVVWVHLKGKDGSKMTYKLVDMTQDIEMDDSIFEFNEGEHPGVECYDE
jgi:outer membrane lipoprotein-sorting protein